MRHPGLYEHPGASQSDASVWLNIKTRLEHSDNKMYCEKHNRSRSRRNKKPSEM